MPTAPPTDGVCRTERLLPFSVADVFKAFAQPGQLARWWGPQGFTNTFEQFEFRPQGRWIFVMHGPDGTHYPNQSVFLETSPNQVVIQHTCAPWFTLTVGLGDVAGQTRVSWRQVFDDPQFVVNLWHVLGPANEQNLDRLHACLEAASTVSDPDTP
jgi:uncharacterized protein YndB with AHSA1/START domain